MTHRFPIKEIARQSGLSTATVDRVLNVRAHVSPQTRNRVRAAIAELEGQEAQLAARGRRLFVDVIVEAPARFSQEVRRACEAVLGTVGPVVFRPRFLFAEVMEADEAAAALDRIARRGSQGVCLKARDLPPVRAAVDRLVAAGVPVVTLVTDVPGSGRTAYAGLANARAGRTAAYLMVRHLGENARGPLLTTRSQRAFFGEEERFTHFAQVMARLCPDVRLVEASGGAGLSRPTAQELEAVAPALRGLLGVYSMGGGNRAILEALRARGLRPRVFIAHDLDVENVALLTDGRLDYVLHHDLETDMRTALSAIAAQHGLSPAAPDVAMSEVQIITPHNLPGRFARAAPGRA